MDPNPYEAPTDGPEPAQPDGRLNAFDWFFVACAFIFAIGMILYLFPGLFAEARE